ncbi:ABC transporter permease [Streptomyces minutiscleroticus]|uniref:ABC transporter permease n=1 Tax=Streptomyces minutiscleroticus TaxID=68238 RepID=A0A918P1L7_9ACTN|nr:ABC transporter permease [Streptomyces minutiscleroticus]GGY13495.1 ABC transporter permease [Streptomyces minutiscleroticus]
MRASVPGLPPWARFAARRAVAGVAVVWGTVTVTFFAIHLAPGDIVDGLIGPGAAATPELRRQIAAEAGLDQPLLVQYGQELRQLASGDFGWSYQLGQPIGRLLGSQVWPTVQLAVSALATALVLAVLAATLTAGRGRAVRGAAALTELLAVSMPSFWLGIILLTALSYRLHVFPSIGAGGPASLVLPTLSLALPLAGLLAQVIRHELETADGRPFVLTARARGLGERALLLRHTLRHALLPLTTLAGFVLGGLFGGAVLVENIFTRPGLGRVLASAVGSRDLPVVTALVVLSSAVFVIVNTLVDLLHPLIDPRLREGGAA